MKRILIIYATAGEGHKRAAVAIKDAFDILNPKDTEVAIVDALDYTNQFFKWLYPRLYIFMVTYIPTIWGFLYYLSDFRWLYPLVKFLRRVGNKNSAIGLEKFLCSYNPDVVITTHFLASEVSSDLRRRCRLNTKLITCVTDFRMHSFWFSEQTDIFCVGFSETKGDLTKKWNFPAQKINVLGIPIRPKFYEAKKKEELYNKLNVSKDFFTVLITGGGFGVGPIMKLVKALLEMEEPLQVLVVCGHNDKLLRQITELSTLNSKPSTVVRTYGFIDYIDELMAVSDIGVTKAGGLICSEALAKELPLVIISPIPGQESRNCRLLLLNKAAFRINRPGQIKRIIKEIYINASLLEGMKENIKRIKQDNPAMKIAKFLSAFAEDHGC